MLLALLAAPLVEGAVFDTLGNPVPGAAVFVPGGSGTYTDARGHFKLPARPGQKLVVVALGFKPETLEASENLVVKLAPSAVMAPEIVVTATGAPELLGKSAAPVSLHKTRPSDLRLVDVLKEVPGVALVGFDVVNRSPGVRGLARHRTVVAFEGARVTDDREVGPNIWVHPWALKDLEVARDAASLAWGADAVGGVVYGELARAKVARARWGSAAGSREAYLGWDPVGFWYETAGDYAYPGGVAANSGYNRAGAYFKTSWASYLLVRGWDIGRPRADGKIKTYLRDYHDILSLFEGSLWTHIWHREYQSGDEISFYNSADGGVARSLDWVFGSHALQAGVQFWGRFNASIVPGLTGGRFLDAGLFVRDKLMLEWADLFAGARLDWLFWTADDNPSHKTWAPTFELGGVFHVKHVHPFLSLRSAFRAPALRDAYFTGDIPAGYQIANPYLEPEKAISAEGGARFTYTDLYAEVSAYRINLFDVLQERVVGDTVWFENMGEGFVNGVEVYLKAQRGSGWLEISGAAQEGWITQEEWVPLKDIPAPWVAFKLGWKGAWFGVRTRAAKVKVGEGEVPRPAFTVLSAGVDWTVKRLTFTLVADNITNELYWENAHSKACPAPGRDVRVGVSLAF